MDLFWAKIETVVTPIKKKVLTLGRWYSTLFKKGRYKLVLHNLLKFAAGAKETCPFENKQSTLE